MRIFRYIKRRGYTDRLYFYNLVFAWLYTLLCLIFSVIGDKIGIVDYSFVSIVCPLVWAEVAIHSAFVVHKAKVENLSRHSLMNNAEWNGNINIDV